MKGPGRALLIFRLRRRNPCMTLDRIGALAGITRERVRQILHQGGLPTKALRQLRLRYECPGCGSILRSPKSRCRACAMGTFVCEVCGKEFQRRVAVQRSLFRRGYKHIFCTRRCRGVYAGRSFGFGAHPPKRITPLGMSRYQDHRAKGLCGCCRAPATHGCLCERHWSKNRTRYKSRPRLPRPHRPRKLGPVVDVVCSLCGRTYAGRKANIRANEAKHGTKNHYCPECYPKRLHRKEVT